jgi:hypothetical protein
MQRWILGSVGKDFSFFVAPGLAALAFVMLFPELASHSVLYMLIAVGFIESGHVYTTFWRTYFHGEERNSSSFYVVVPLVIFVVFAIWMYLGRVGLWSFVAYANIFHHVRQYYGFGRWYQGLNRRFAISSDLFLYALCALPIVAYHFKPGAIGGYYSDNDLLLHPNPTLFWTVTAAYAITWFCWIFVEVRERRSEWNRIVSIALPAVLYGTCFYFGRDIATILTPLVISHGFAYFGVMGDSLTKTQTKRFPTFVRALAIVIVTALVAGGIEFYADENWIDFRDSGPGGSWLVALMTGLYLVPLFSHFVFDARIWRRKHREAPLVFEGRNDQDPSNEPVRLIS